MARRKFMSLALIGLVAIVAACALLQQTSAMSIETSDPQKPVKVTHKNSGPSYDVVLDLKSDEEQTNSDQVEKKRVVGEQEQPGVQISAVPGSAPARTEESDGPMGHVTIRRVFLFPLVARPSDANESEQQDSAKQRMPMVLPLHPDPFWSIMRPSGSLASSESEARPQRNFVSPFGHSAWQQSPSSKQEGGEREEAGHRPAFDTLRMLLDMMHQSINEQLVPPSEPVDKVGEAKENAGSDLNKEASSESAEKEGDDPKRPLVPKNKPQSRNETTEEVVEIDGKKYLKKSVINRHVGENLIFMTKRLIFVPLNETDSTITSTSFTPTPRSAEEPSSTVENKSENEPTTTTTTSTVRPETEATNVVERNVERAEPAPSATGPAQKKTEATTAATQTEQPKVSSTATPSSTTTNKSNDNNNQ